MARHASPNAMEVSEAVRKLNPGLFAQPLVIIKPEGLGKQMADKIARDTLKIFKITPEPEPGPRYRSKWEKEFHGILKVRFPQDFIEHEPITLKLAHKSKFTPDFGVVSEHPIIEDNSNAYKVTFWEVKGFWREAARVRIKVAARLFPWARFIAVVKQKKKDGGGWKEEEFRP